MLFEFIQVLFFIFYKVEIINEFKIVEELSPNPPENFSVPVNNSSNPSNISLTNGTGNNSSFSESPDRVHNLETFRIDKIVTFINFQFYTIQNGQENSFLTLYCIFSGLFLLFLTLLFGLSNRIFEASKGQDLKEGMKLMVKSLSIILSLFLFLL